MFIDLALCIFTHFLQKQKTEIQADFEMNYILQHYFFFKNKFYNI